MPLEPFSLVVDDYDAAIEFFTDTLDFVLAEDSPVPDDGRTTEALGCRPPSKRRPGLVLARADGEEQVTAVGRQFAGRVGLFLCVDDFENTHIRLQLSGASLVRPPREEAHGRVCVFEDP